MQSSWVEKCRGYITEGSVFKSPLSGSGDGELTERKRVCVGCGMGGVGFG